MMTAEKKQEIDLEYDKLSDKAKSFIKHYIVTKNGAESARLAGYSHKGADSKASQLLADARIRKYIDQRLDWSFDEWANRVKQVYLDHPDNWQASLKALELYGKGKGFCRDNSVTINQLSVNSDDIARLRKSLSAKHLEMASDGVEGGGVERVGEPPATPLDMHSSAPKNAQQNNES